MKKQTLAEEIKELREMRGDTQVSFAAALGVSAATVRDWEQGRNLTARPICRAAIDRLKGGSNG